jgi:hypothetical protein
MSKFWIVVVAEERGTAGARVDGASGWPDSLQAASRTTERRAQATRGMERSLEGGKQMDGWNALSGWLSHVPNGERRVTSRWIGGMSGAQA